MSSSLPRLSTLLPITNLVCVFLFEKKMATLCFLSPFCWLAGVLAIVYLKNLHLISKADAMKNESIYEIRLKKSVHVGFSYVLKCKCLCQESSTNVLKTSPFYRSVDHWPCSNMEKIRPVSPTPRHGTEQIPRKPHHLDSPHLGLQASLTRPVYCCSLALWQSLWPPFSFAPTSTESHMRMPDCWQDSCSSHSCSSSSMALPRCISPSSALYARYSKLAYQPGYELFLFHGW